MTKPQPKDASELKGKTGLRRLINATRYSAQGFKAAWKTEDAFRQESVLAVILIPVAVLLPVSLVYKLLLIGSIILVLIVEVLNSAIEAVVDRFGGEIHPLSGKAKDLGSAAVLLALTLALITWVSILADAFL
ncbi:diacylglycerol kinase [uncultured Parasutterella sp.]|uniref:diacylglycerol kinase n=1 Tax=uncultured Parasutterella sp. TaxID=1263098 RepID=UPI002591B089|nr:diacylglycerol kinase [uncultured Parasutterella sp.]